MGVLPGSVRVHGSPRCQIAGPSPSAIPAPLRMSDAPQTPSCNARAPVSCPYRSRPSKTSPSSQPRWPGLFRAPSVAIAVDGYEVPILRLEPYLQ
ncbi:hypothetical protein P152DRAFT_57017 [Eremomyces bilateralis CBS 781.70]|uniref:Uncharacterized protein n=1 Tax=Eremomyces bilateralis CBS 781.70 TaxID=1392243 RepID=A0A6G1G027_9PEZI|nr:uncharacterized protein P152DRAFT_57017 [Eremomyces bilateralis CBS 781.70]KAF1811465.1 hypothetical protein P152DRAFT_57017 [Eremomyces bilateralis CBS 781.70]